ncbi:MAG: ASCH domain-containing protein [Lentisphaeria bacterium]
MDDILISIKPQYVDKILSGDKLIELRTRKMNIPEGTKVWIYSTMPKGEIAAFVMVKKIELISPENAWKKHSKVLCVQKDDFDKYTDGKTTVCLIYFNKLKELPKKISLNQLRLLKKGFCPPQFFMKLDQNQQIAKVLNSICVAEQ